MAIRYTWNFSGFKVKPYSDDLKDVLVSYEWRRIATEDKYTVDVYGSISLPEPNPEDFTEYCKLTKTDLENFTISLLTQEVVDNYDASLASSIETLKDPPVVDMKAPWNSEVKISGATGILK